jgi:hypothetical protein
LGFLPCSPPPEYTGDHKSKNMTFPHSLLQKTRLIQGSPNTPLAFCALMSLIEPLLWQVLFELDTFANWRHCKYLGFKAGRVTCGWAHSQLFPLSWSQMAEGTKQGRGCSSQGEISLLGC